MGKKMLNDSTETKIWRCSYPILIYLFVNMMVQVAFYIGVTTKAFLKLGEEDIFNYFQVYSFSSQIETIVNEHGLLVSIVTYIVTIPICLYILKKELNSEKYISTKERLKMVDLQKWYFLIGIGFLASLGLSKVVTIFPIDNILGNYADVNSSFESNPLIFQIFALVILGPVAEEIIYRGLIYKRIKGYSDAVVGTYLSSIIFGIVHFNLVQGLYALALGVILCYVYEKYKTIFAPIILHISANLMALIVMKIPFFDKLYDILLIKIVLMLIEMTLLLLLIMHMSKKIGGKDEDIIDSSTML